MASADTFLRALGRRVREFRELRRLSQESLAAAAGLTQKYVSQIETGTVNPSIQVLRVLAEDGLKVPLATMLTFSRKNAPAAELADEVAAMLSAESSDTARRGIEILRAFLGTPEGGAPGRRANSG